MGVNAMWCLFAQYIIVSGVFAWERDWARSGYYASAAAINLSVIFMAGAK